MMTVNRIADTHVIHSPQVGRYIPVKILSLEYQTGIGLVTPAPPGWEARHTSFNDLKDW